MSWGVCKVGDQSHLELWSGGSSGPAALSLWPGSSQSQETRSAGLWEQMCKESQRPLHSLKNPWPCWSVGAAGHGLLSRASTFSTAPLGRGVAETSFRRLSPGRDVRARVLWLIQPWEQPSYEDQTVRTNKRGNHTSWRCRGRGLTSQPPPDTLCQNAVSRAKWLWDFCAHEMWASQESLSVKPTFLVHKILQVLARSQAFTFSSERTSKEQSCHKGHF